MYPKHLKLNAVLSSLDSPEAIGRSARQPIGVPIFLRAWTAVEGLLKGAGQSMNWVWQMVRRIMQRVGKLFGVQMRIPEAPPAAGEPAAQLHAVANEPSEQVAVAQNLADASAEAAAQANSFLDEILSTFPDRERLKQLGGPAFLSDVLRTLGTRLEALQAEEAAAAESFRTAVDGVAGELGVTPMQVVSLVQTERASGAFTQLAPLWKQLHGKRTEIAKVRESFCSYCILALRAPDGVDQSGVDEVAGAAIQRWADASMQARIDQGVRALAIEGALKHAEEPSPPANAPSADPVQAAAKEAFGAQEPSPPARPDTVSKFSDMMSRFRSMGALDETSGDSPSKPTA